CVADAKDPSGRVSCTPGSSARGCGPGQRGGFDDEGRAYYRKKEDRPAPGSCHGALTCPKSVLHRPAATTTASPSLGAGHRHRGAPPRHDKDLGRPTDINRERLQHGRQDPDAEAYAPAVPRSW